MLSVENVSKAYTGKFGPPVHALKRISVEFPDRGLVFILGKSGSGKSTLLNIIGGLDAPTSGDIVVKGRSSAAFKESDFDSYRNTCVGYVFQEYDLMDDQTVGRNVSVALELQGKTADKAVVDSFLRRVDLVDIDGETLFTRFPNELSGGQKQRVAIARALVKDPEIILADEPTGALDSKTGNALYELLKSLSEEKLVIVVTHDEDCARRYGDRIIELADGLVASDTAEGFSRGSDENAPERAGGFIKSRLPFKRTIALAAGGLKARPMRLALSIFLTVIAVGIFGFCMTAATTNEYRSELRAIYDDGLEMVTITAYNYNYVPKENDKKLLPMTDAQLKAIEEYSGGKAMLTYYPPLTDNIRRHFGEAPPSYADDLSNPYLALGMWNDLAIELDPQTGMEDARLRPDDRFVDPSLCRLPQTVDEIAITDLHADLFMRFGYRAPDAGDASEPNIANIQTPDDMIGKTLDRFTVVGVYSTEQDLNYFKRFDFAVDNNDFARDDPYNHDYFYASKESIISAMFLCKGYRAHSKNNIFDVRSLTVRLSGDLRKDLALTDKLNYSENGQEKSVRLRSSYSTFLYPLNLMREYMTLPFVIGAIVFSVFAALLMLNFMTISIDYKSRELGILRALGASGRNIMGVCLTESMIVALIDSCATVTALAVVCAVINSFFYLPLFVLGFAPILPVFALCFVVAGLGTALPTVRITRKKPIDILHGK